eukprot:gene3896-4984_t
MAEAMGGSCIFEIVKGYPFLKNHPELTRRVRTAATTYMGAENVVDLDLLGTRNEAKGIISGVHTPTFD